MDVKKKLNELINIVIEEMEKNPEFSVKIENVLAGKINKNNNNTKKKRSRRQPAIINPLEVIIEGDEILLSKLEQLDIDQLKDIITEYSMNPTKSALNWKNKERLKERLIKDILEISAKRVNKGNAFRCN